MPGNGNAWRWHACEWQACMGSGTLPGYRFAAADGARGKTQVHTMCVRLGKVCCAATAYDHGTCQMSSWHKVCQCIQPVYLRFWLSALLPSTASLCDHRRCELQPEPCLLTEDGEGCRFGAGGRYRASTMPEEPLIVWGYEASPFVRLVKVRPLFEEPFVPAALCRVCIRECSRVCGGLCSWRVIPDCTGCKCAWTPGPCLKVVSC